jgi:hypothetical protein
MEGYPIQKLGTTLQRLCIDKDSSVLYSVKGNTISDADCKGILSLMFFFIWRAKLSITGIHRLSHGFKLAGQASK